LVSSRNFYNQSLYTQNHQTNPSPFKLHLNKEYSKMDTSAPSTTTTTNNHNTPNPPSIELAYKKKCIQLKKRLNEIEAENDLIRARNKRAKFYVAKMRLETCIMLERLATVTGMLDEASSSAAAGGAGGQQGGGQISAELRAKAAAIVTSAHAQSTQGLMDDETEGSSEEQPPTVCTFPLLLSPDSQDKC
jgi:solute carrier family 25 phosphate transporter 3